MLEAHGSPQAWEGKHIWGGSLKLHGGGRWVSVALLLHDSVTFMWICVAATEVFGWQNFHMDFFFSFKKQENKLRLSLFLALSRAGAQES